MRRPIVLLGSVATIAVLLAGGYVAALVAGRHELDAATARIRDGLGPGGTFTYASSTIHPLSGSAELRRVTLRQPSGLVLAADRLDIAAGLGGRVRSARATPVDLAFPAGTAHAAFLDVFGLSLPPPDAAGRYDPAAISFDHAVLRDAVLHAAGNSATLSTSRIENLDHGRAARIEATGFTDELETPTGPLHVSAATADLAGITLLSPNGGAAGPRPGDSAGHIDRVVLSGRDRSPIDIAEIRFDGRTAVDRSTTAHATVAGLVVAPANPDDAATLRSASLDQVHGSMTMEVAYDPAKGTLHVPSTVLAVDRIGALAVSVGVDGIDDAALRAARSDRTATARVLLASRLVSASLRFTDGGLLDTLYRRTAERDGLAVPALRDRVATILAADPRLLALAPNGSLARAASGFARDGGSIALRVAPDPTLPFADLSAAAASPASLLPRIGLGASHSAPAASAAASTL